jgi:hypothetical protein
MFVQWITPIPVEPKTFPTRGHHRRLLVDDLSNPFEAAEKAGNLLVEVDQHIFLLSRIEPMSDDDRCCCGITIVGNAMGNKTALPKGPKQAVHMPGLFVRSGVYENASSLMVDLLTESTRQSIAVTSGAFTEYIKINLGHGFSGR